MKKLLIGAGIMIFLFIGIFSHNWFSEQVEKVDKVINPEYEKIDDVRGILDKVLEHIAEINPELSFIDGQLVDSELALPRFEVVDIATTLHFNVEDIVDGYVVRPVVGVENPKLLIVAQAVDMKASARIREDLNKVKSDQYEEFVQADMWVQHLIDTNEIERQGNFLIYVTWDDAKELVKVFQRHVQ